MSMLFDELRVAFANRSSIPTQPIEFRLYGLDSDGGSWAIDNFALIAGLVSPATFDLPPTAPPQVITTIGDATPPSIRRPAPADPDGDPLAISERRRSRGDGRHDAKADGQYVFLPPPADRQRAAEVHASWTAGV